MRSTSTESFAASHDTALCASPRLTSSTKALTEHLACAQFGDLLVVIAEYFCEQRLRVRAEAGRGEAHAVVAP